MDYLLTTKEKLVPNPETRFELYRCNKKCHATLAWPMESIIWAGGGPLNQTWDWCCKPCIDVNDLEMGETLEEFKRRR